MRAAPPLAGAGGRYAQSRHACIDAAVRLLQIQFELHIESQPGGRLFNNRWKLVKCIPDFLLGGYDPLP